MSHHIFYEGKLHVYKRPNSRHWQCSTYLAGKNRRKSTKEESLALAKQIAEDWFFELKGKKRAGQLNDEKTFREAAEQFLLEYPLITQGQRNAEYVAYFKTALDRFILPVLGDDPLSKVTSGRVQEYRLTRVLNRKTGKPLARTTTRHDIVIIRQVLKTAYRHGWLLFVPDLSQPYKTAGKVGHRAWFSREEYERLYEASRARTKLKGSPRWTSARQQMHDYILFMVNTGLRPDEAKRLEVRDASVVHDEDTGETILLIEVRGKRGVGYCKSMPGAVRPFQRVCERNGLQSTDRLFPRIQRELFDSLLNELGMKRDREGNARTAYSLRHTYICLRLLQGADIYQVAKNCRTSVEMIEKHYAVHLKNTLNAAAINVRRVTRHKKKRRRIAKDVSTSIPLG